jgi:hypothetical protein
MSRKMLAAIGTTLSAPARARWLKSRTVYPPKITRPATDQIKFEAEDGRESCNEEKDSDPAAQVAPDRGAEGRAAERQGDEPHHLPE